MPREKRILSPQKTFAIAYRIFNTLDHTPKRSADYAESLCVSVGAVKSVVTMLGRMGCIVTKRGGAKNSGISRPPGVTVKDLFSKFSLPYREGVEFEKEIDGQLRKATARTRTCEICKAKHKDPGIESICVSCKKLDIPVYEKQILAKCGHYSKTRYFHCEECKPILEDNTTPDDFGCSLSL